MARPLRIQSPGAIYHVISRGNGGMTIFHNDKDRLKFLSFMLRVYEKYNWICHAYCLMGNHYHQLLETSEGNLIDGMKQLNQFYSQFFNWKHGRKGSVLQGRYKALLVEKESQFLENARYIVNNPVNTGLVDHPSKWPWSSFSATRGLEKGPPFLQPEYLLKHFAASRTKAQQKYEAFVLAGVGQESPLKLAKKQIFLGSDEFISEMMRFLDGHDELNNVPKIQKFADRPNLKTIFHGVPSISKTVRNNLILNAHDVLAYTQKEIAKFLGLYPGYVSRIILNLRKSAKGEN
jgi:REP element-mobilizing transposase RayT